MSLTPTPHLTVDAGKKLMLWGKGYAWNPVGFINPPKDPDDPALNLEGNTILGVDLIKSLATGGLTNFGLTAMLLPGWQTNNIWLNRFFFFALYGIIPTFQPANFGRVYAAYGGVFIVLSILWGWKVDGIEPDRFDIFGALIALKVRVKGVSSKPVGRAK